MPGSLGWRSSGRPVKYDFGEAAGKLWRSATIFMWEKETKTTSESGRNNWKSLTNARADPNLGKKKWMSEKGAQIVHQRLSAAFRLALTQTERIRARRSRCQTERNALIKARRGEGGGY